MPFIYDHTDGDGVTLKVSGETLGKYPVIIESSDRGDVSGALYGLKPADVTALRAALAPYDPSASKPGNPYAGETHWEVSDSHGDCSVLHERNGIAPGTAYLTQIRASDGEEICVVLDTADIAELKQVLRERFPDENDAPISAELWEAAKVGPSLDGKRRLALEVAVGLAPRSPFGIPRASDVLELAHFLLGEDDE
jgi:hypothetical protein